MVGLMVVAVWFAVVAAYLVCQWRTGELAHANAEHGRRKVDVGHGAVAAGVRITEWGVRDSALRPPLSVFNHAGTLSR